MYNQMYRYTLYFVCSGSPRIRLPCQVYQPVQQPSAVVAALAKSQFHLPFRI